MNFETTNELYPNCWAALLFANYDLLTPQNKEYADKFRQIETIFKYEEFHNILCFDAYSMECIYELANNLSTLKKLGKKITIPSFVDNTQPTLIYNRCESWAGDILFDAIHLIIDLLNLQGAVVYTNCSYNLDDVYKKYCNRNNKPIKVKCYYNNNTSWYALHNPHLMLPNVKIDELSLIDKKLFSSFNWNAWEHRLGLIVLLHYYDLLDEGYVTSPGRSKFDYDPIADFEMLKISSYSYIGSLPNRDEIYQKLESLRNNYPLKIDDRRQYSHTDDPLTVQENLHFKIPMLTARHNSIFEIITETRFFGEHFFSEKTFNVIALGRPFVIMSSPNILKSFRKLGFKSFSPYIDESYDDIEDNSQRLLAIVKEVKRLSDMRKNDPTSFYKMVDTLSTIAQYNLEYFTLTARQHYHHYTDYQPFIRYFKVC